MKKSLLAVLVAGILLLTAGAFAGTITIDPIPDVIVVNDGDPTGTRGDNNFAFSKPFAFADYVGLDIPGSSVEPVTLSYYVTGESGAILPEYVATIEGVAHGTAVDGSGNTTPVVLGEVTALDADGALNVEFSGVTSYSSGDLGYNKTVVLVGESADTNPGQDTFGIYVEDGTGFSNVDRFSGQPPILDYDFESGAQGWVFSDPSAQLGSSTGEATGGELKITYGSLSSGNECWSFWRKGPSVANVFSWEEDTLYVVEADITSSVTPSGGGATDEIPDFRLWSGDDANDGMCFRLISNQPSDGGAGYISPLPTGTAYKWVIEPDVMPASTAGGMLHFEGFSQNAADMGESVAMQAVRMYKVSGVDVTEAGTAVGSISGAAMAENSTEWQWTYVGSGTATIPELTKGSSTGALTMTYPTDADTGLVYYGSWVTNPYAAPTQSMNFTEQTLYRATFNISTSTVDYASFQNHILGLCAVRSKDAHVATAAARFAQFGTTIRLDPSGTDVNVWWYYEGGARAAGGWEEQLMFAFDGTASVGNLTTLGNVLTLNSITVTEHGSLPAYK